MINLPAAFTERMKQMLGREYDAFIASYDKERSQGLRVNGLKTDPAEFAKTAPFSLNPVAWAAEGFAYGAEDRPGRHPYHDAGVYYIQEPSAMIAASLLNPQPGEMILDLCAAPGGKSTQAAARLGGEGVGFIDFLELFLGILIAGVVVRVVLHGQLAVSLFDLRIGGRFGYSQHFVVIALFLCHNHTSIKPAKAAPAKPERLLLLSGTPARRFGRASAVCVRT